MKTIILATCVATILFSCQSNNSKYYQALSTVDSMNTTETERQKTKDSIVTILPNFTVGLKEDEQGIYTFDDAYIFHLKEKGNWDAAKLCLKYNYLYPQSMAYYYNAQDIAKKMDEGPNKQAIETQLYLFRMKIEAAAYKN